MHQPFHFVFLAPIALIACATVPALASNPARAAPSATVNDPAKAANLAEQPAGLYVVEPTHTSVHWRLSHSGLSNYTARFDKISGSITFDPKTPTASRANIAIEATSVNTGLPEFDAKIAKDVFKAEANPLITFKSTKLVATSPTTGTMTGDLTLAGVTKPVTLNVVYNSGRINPFVKVQNIGFSATGSFKRSDFGVNNWINFGIGDQVDLIIEAEFLKKD
ncbi:YceI family protein [Candidatus Phycosocius spiralis]|uniref:Polyisoprenoid-binding protein n=1 Tax=Candidatus Phycosocius spiralis TaxID=2815099 RepID=A0ABQ4PXN4_9PROT|nr:YceI family protein [Candidatus Phycosocius spiralis]GIU67844.1 polyisoprenoid-binding protein [Candidatus Phycosocius spiralis]